MAELFTEEDVRKIKDCIVNPSTRLPKRDGENFPTWAARAILSALAEDGRLQPAPPPYFPGMTIGQIISSRGFVPIEDEPTESGGALPSDAPALEGFEAQWTVRRDGVIYSPQSEREAHEYAAKYPFYELMRRFVGPWEPVPDPVSVLEEETRERE